MFDRIAAFVTSLALTTLSWAAAQPQTLNLEFGGDLYLSHVSDGLEGLASYRQTSVATTLRPGEDGEPVEQEQVDARAYVAATNDWASLTEADLMPGVTMIANQYRIGGRGFMLGGSDGELSCFEMPADSLDPTPLETHVADVTGFKSATLAATGETVNGVLANRYTLDRPPYAGRYEDGTLEGEVWVAQDGGFIVRYEITGTDAEDVTTVWTYDLTDVGTLEGVDLPEACAAL